MHIRWSTRDTQRQREVEIKSENYETLTTYCWPFCHLSRKYDTFFPFPNKLDVQPFKYLYSVRWRERKKKVGGCSTLVAIRIWSEVHCYWSFGLSVEFFPSRFIWHHILPQFRECFARLLLLRLITFLVGLSCWQLWFCHLFIFICIFFIGNVKNSIRISCRMPAKIAEHESL